MAKIVTFKPRSRQSPRTVLRKVGRPSDAEQGRTRSHLTESELDRLLTAAKAGRYGHRDYTLLLLMYRHGLRVSEAIDLQWVDVDLKAARLNVRRLKGSKSGTHPLEGVELRALRKLRQNAPGAAFVFVTERGGPMVRSNVSKLVRAAGERAGIRFPVTPHALRHTCGFVLANRGIPTRTLQEYMGHAQIANTVRYTQLSDRAFRGLWN